MYFDNGALNNQNRDDVTTDIPRARRSKRPKPGQSRTTPPGNPGVAVSRRYGPCGMCKRTKLAAVQCINCDYDLICVDCKPLHDYYYIHFPIPPLATYTFDYFISRAMTKFYNCFVYCWNRLKGDSLPDTTSNTNSNPQTRPTYEPVISGTCTMCKKLNTAALKCNSCRGLICTNCKPLHDEYYTCHITMPPYINFSLSYCVKAFNRSPWRVPVVIGIYIYFAFFYVISIPNRV